MKRKQINWILGGLCDLARWPYPWPWPWISKVKVWKDVISGMGGPIDMERRGCELTIHDHGWPWWAMGDHGGVVGCTGQWPGLTLDIGMPSTHLVKSITSINWSLTFTIYCAFVPEIPWLISAFSILFKRKNLHWKPSCGPSSAPVQVSFYPEAPVCQQAGGHMWEIMNFATWNWNACHLFISIKRPHLHDITSPKLKKNKTSDLLKHQWPQIITTSIQ